MSAQHVGMAARWEESALPSWGEVLSSLAGVPAPRDVEAADDEGPGGDPSLSEWQPAWSRAFHSHWSGDDFPAERLFEAERRRQYEQHLPELLAPDLLAFRQRRDLLDAPAKQLPEADVEVTVRIARGGYLPGAFGHIGERRIWLDVTIGLWWFVDVLTGGHLRIDDRVILHVYRRDSKQRPTEVLALVEDVDLGEPVVVGRRALVDWKMADDPRLVLLHRDHHAGPPDVLSAG
jgi:hypothetical protein